MLGNQKEQNSSQQKCIVLSIVALTCFLAIAVIYSSGYFDSINQVTNLYAASIQTEMLTDAAILISRCFDTIILLGLTLLLGGLLLYKKDTQQGMLLIGAMGINVFLLLICKTVVISPRPLNALVVENDYSFPSGHVTSTIIFVGMLSYFAWQKRNTITKLCLVFFGSALVGIVAFDRVYLNVHWLSDVIAAPFIAVFIIATTILTIQYLPRRYSRKLKHIICFK